MKVISGTFYDRESAAKYLGVSPDTLRRADEHYGLSTKIGGAKIYDAERLKEFQTDRESYMSQSDVARHFGISRQAVNQAFSRWGFVPNTVSPYTGMESYKRSTVEEFASKIGWKTDG